MLKAVEIRNTGKGNIIIDGYTSNKTKRGIVNDIAKAVARVDEAEAEAIINIYKDGDEICVDNGPYEYALEYESYEDYETGEIYETYFYVRLVA